MATTLPTTEQLSGFSTDTANVGSGEQLTFAEFFAGIGLVHLGLKPLGWSCVYANDIDSKKKQMYEDMFGKVDYYHVEDVWETRQVIERIPSNVLLATASFPCVDLSLAGNRKGMAGVDSGAFYGFSRALQKLRDRGDLPALVLIENVQGFLTSHAGSDFANAAETLARLGYFLDAIVVDAKYFVPQSRPRLFLIGCQGDVLPNELKTSNPPCASAVRPVSLVNAIKRTRLSTGWFSTFLPDCPPVQRTLDCVVDRRNEQDWWDDSAVQRHLDEMHITHRERLHKLVGADVETVGTIYRRVRQGKSRSEIRTDGLAGCLRTPRGGSSRQIVFVAGNGKLRMRWMSPTEYAALQGAPNFPIKVERNQALFGFGDAVCVPVISWIAEHAIAQFVPNAATFARVR